MNPYPEPDQGIGMGMGDRNGTFIFHPYQLSSHALSSSLDVIAEKMCFLLQRNRGSFLPILLFYLKV